MREEKIIQKLTKHARKSLLHASKIAQDVSSEEIKPEHLLYAIFLERGCVGSTILVNLALQKKHFTQEIFDKVPVKQKSKILTKTLPLDSTVKKILTDAFAIATDFGYPYVGTEHIVYTLLETKTPALTRILKNKKSVTAENTTIRAHKKNDRDKHDDTITTSASLPLTPDAMKQISQMLGIDGLTLTASDTDEHLDALTQFTTPADDTPHTDTAFVGYHDAISRVITILGRRTKNNPIIVGEPGVGKTALVEHIARLAHTPEAPAHIRGKEIRILDLALLIAGTSFRGEFEQRLKEVIAQAQGLDNVILFIDEIHTIVGTGNIGGSLDAANILKPALARRGLQIIGATTFDEYKKHIIKDAALARRFQKVTLEEPSPKEACAILRKAKKIYEKHHAITFTPQSILAAVDFSIRYIPEQYLPDKAFDLLDETAARVHGEKVLCDDDHALHDVEALLTDLAQQKTDLLQKRQYEEATLIQQREVHAQKKHKKLSRAQEQRTRINRHTVTENDIAQTVSEMTNIPLHAITNTPHKTIAHAHKILRANIFGQSTVIETITETLMRAATGITPDCRPRGSFLFLGDTGIGKTLTAQTLAREIYGSDKALIRIDMSEFSEGHNTSKLLGAPAGYIGYGESPTLTEKVRRAPYSIVLFDEIEKAHPDTFNLLLQILEDGSLTDSEGRKADFRNTVIILTSNIGSSAGTETALGFDSHTRKERHDRAQKTAQEFLPKELLSRLDHIIVFNPLSQKALTQIVRKELASLKKRMHKKGMQLTIDRTLANTIAIHVYKEHGNARTVRTVLQKSIETRIAKTLLDNPAQTTLRLRAKDGIITSL